MFEQKRLQDKWYQVKRREDAIRKKLNSGSREYQTIAKQDYYEIQTDPGLAADDRERIKNDDPISEETMKQNLRIQR